MGAEKGGWIPLSPYMWEKNFFKLNLKDRDGPRYQRQRENPKLGGGRNQRLWRLHGWSGSGVWAQTPRRDKRPVRGWGAGHDLHIFQGLNRLPCS